MNRLNLFKEFFLRDKEIWGMVEIHLKELEESESPISSELQQRVNKLRRMIPSQEEHERIEELLKELEGYENSVESRKNLVVYISKTGATYHKSDSCGYLQSSHGWFEVSYKSVKECKYKPCPNCW